MTQRIVSGILAAALLLGFPAVAAAPDELREILPALHDGRFDAAQARLEALPDANRRPEVLFFRAFVTYWRLIYDNDNPSLRSRLERQVNAVQLRTDDLRDEDPSVALWAGSAHLLLAQLRAIEKKSLAAAMEAKRARKDLNTISAPESLVAEAMFGVGTYNYMADRVPAFVKGLRSLLFIPAGDRELGLRQLERAANESKWFGVESRLLLVTIAANRHERRFQDAVAQAALARRDHPDSLIVAHAAAKLLISLAKWEDAARVLDPALARMRELRGVDPSVSGTLELVRARLDFANLRPDLAATRATALSTSRGRLPKEVRDGARQLAAAASDLIARPWWPEAKSHLLGASGSENGTVPPASESAERAAVMTFITARQALAAGRAAEALTGFASAESSGALPEAWLGACRLLAGQAADVQGLRAKAITYYKRAETTPGFIAREAAIAYQARPYEAATE